MTAAAAAAPTLDEDARASLDAAVRAFRLKDEPRRGWVLRRVVAPESVAAHAWGTAMLCLLFGARAGVDTGRALAIATVHDAAEALTGDIAARADPADRDVTEADKRRAEELAMVELAGRDGGEIVSLWREYEERSSPEARFVRDMNLVDMCLQALLYEQGERYDTDHVLPSRGGHTRLDEFFASARPRLGGALARALIDEIERRYRSARNGRR